MEEVAVSIEMTVTKKTVKTAQMEKTACRRQRNTLQLEERR